MTARRSLNESMDNAVKHYASLFKLPGYSTIILLQITTCMVAGIFPTSIFLQSLEGLTYGLFVGISLFLTSSAIDCLTAMLVLRQDPIYDIRRISTLSLLCLAVCCLFNIVGAIIGRSLGLQWWIRSCLLGFSAILTFRQVVLFASSSIGQLRIIVASIMQPFFCLLPLVVLWKSIGYSVTPGFALFLAVSPAVGFFSTRLFLFLLDRVGTRELQVSSMSLFRAFLLNWVVGLNTPFERFLETLSEEKNVEARILRFDSSRLKAAVVVPSVHPGPFKNIGSSLLPSMLKTALEEKLDCVACVPLGLQSHELDLASQLQSKKVIGKILDSMDFKAPESMASPFVKVTLDEATVCCQIFGSFGILSFSLAPHTTEDLPRELGEFVRDESRKRGLGCLVLVNAHNSINGVARMPEALDSLKAAAAACLENALSLERCPFEIGVSTILQTEYALKDGMGAGGITAIVVKTDDQKTAYVVIDGNNMISGLREKIIAALQSAGLDDCEVFTTDTHSVSALILGKRGYHPIGEAMNHDKLIYYIIGAVGEAMKNLEAAKGGCRTIIVPKVKVIGEERLNKLSLLTEMVLHRAKRSVIPLFGFAGVALMLFSYFV